MPAADDEAWAEALAGRAPAPADAATVHEARLLREALRRWPAAPPPARLDEAALLAAARAQGLLPRSAPGCARCTAIRRRLLARPMLWGGLGGLTLAGVLGLAILPGLLAPPPDEAGTLRGPAGAVLREADDPVAARDALAARLRAAGADVQTYERAGRAGLDAAVAAPPDADLAAWLAARGLAPAADGSLRVEYRRRAP